MKVIFKGMKLHVVGVWATIDPKLYICDFVSTLDLGGCTVYYV